MGPPTENRDFGGVSKGLVKKILGVSNNVFWGLVIILRGLVINCHFLEMGVSNNFEGVSNKI